MAAAATSTTEVAVALQTHELQVKKNFPQDPDILCSEFIQVANT